MMKQFKAGDKVLVTGKRSGVSKHFNGRVCTVKYTNANNYTDLVEEEEIFLEYKGIWKDELTHVKKNQPKDVI